MRNDDFRPRSRIWDRSGIHLKRVRTLTVIRRYRDSRLRALANVGKNLVKQIPSVSKDATSYISSVLLDSMLILPVDNNEVINVVKSLKEICAGHDGIIAKVLKITCNSFVEPLCHVLNLSLTNGYFPDQLKLAQVVPVFRSGDKLQIGNYSPVSILPTFSKIFEQVMYSRLISFLEKHSVLYNYHFGFRQEHSTNLALTLLVDKILKSWKSGNLVELWIIFGLEQSI